MARTARQAATALARNPFISRTTRSLGTPAEEDRAGRRAVRRFALAVGAPAHELLVRRHVLADDVEEVVGAEVAEELQPLAQVGDGGVEALVRAQVVAERAVLALELEHLLGVVHGGLDLAPV